MDQEGSCVVSLNVVIFQAQKMNITSVRGRMHGGRIGEIKVLETLIFPNLLDRRLIDTAAYTNIH